MSARNGREGLTPNSGSLPQEEAHVRAAFANDDGVGVGEGSPVNVDDEIPFGQAGERSVHAAQKFIVRRARSDRFPNG